MNRDNIGRFAKKAKVITVVVVFSAYTIAVFAGGWSAHKMFGSVVEDWAKPEVAKVDGRTDEQKAFDAMVDKKWQSKEHQNVCRAQAESEIALILSGKYLEMSKNAQVRAVYELPRELTVENVNNAVAIREANDVSRAQNKDIIASFSR